MSLGGQPEAWLAWFGSPPPDCVNEWRYAEWRANYDEACGIARYFRWMAERRSEPGVRGAQERG
jgi:hypothetical protein